MTDREPNLVQMWQMYQASHEPTFNEALEELHTALHRLWHDMRAPLWRWAEGVLSALVEDIRAVSLSWKPTQTEE